MWGSDFPVFTPLITINIHFEGFAVNMNLFCRGKVGPGLIS